MDDDGGGGEGNPLQGFELLLLRNIYTLCWCASTSALLHNVSHTQYVQNGRKSCALLLQFNNKLKRYNG